MDIYYTTRGEAVNREWCEGLGLRITIHQGQGWFTQDAPAVYSYYAMSNGDKILGSHTKTELKVHAAKHKGFGSIHRVTAHTTLRFQDNRLEPEVIGHAPVNNPHEQHHNWTLEEACDDLHTKLVYAARDFKHHADETVAIMLSGGSDSCGNLFALLEAGYKVKAYTVTIEDDGFDAIEAAKLAKQFGIEHKVLKFPKKSEEVFKLMKASVMVTGATDYANVTMGCLTEFALRHIQERVVFHGHFGDSFFGNRGTLFGAFKRDFPEQQNADMWNYWRWLTQSHGSTPQNAQIDSLHQQHGKEWRALYAHPAVQANIFGCGLHVTPIKKGKKHLRHMLNKHVEDGSWLRDGKNQYGYPEGAGINGLKESCPFLRKENCGKLYPQIIKLLTGAS